MNEDSLFKPGLLAPPPHFPSQRQRLINFLHLPQMLDERAGIVCSLVR